MPTAHETGSAPSTRSPRPPEVLCVGEAMVLLMPQPGTTLADTPSLKLYVAGAESNVACGLAHLGHDVETGYLLSSSCLCGLAR